jgi:hypothetical protein
LKYDFAVLLGKQRISEAGEVFRNDLRGAVRRMFVGVMAADNRGTDWAEVLLPDRRSGASPRGKGRRELEKLENAIDDRIAAREGPTAMGATKDMRQLSIRPQPRSQTKKALPVLVPAGLLLPHDRLRRVDGRFHRIRKARRNSLSRRAFCSRGDRIRT